MGLLKFMFLDLDLRLFLTFPLALSLDMMRFFWLFGKKGNYFVKRSYRAFMSSLDDRLPSLVFLVKVDGMGYGRLMSHKKKNFSFGGVL